MLLSSWAAATIAAARRVRPVVRAYTPGAPATNQKPRPAQIATPIYHRDARTISTSTSSGSMREKPMRDGLTIHFRNRA